MRCLCITFVLLIGWYFGGRSAMAGEVLQTGPSYRDLTVAVPKLKVSPTIDGKVEPAEWADAGMAPRLITMRDDGDDRLTDLEGRFYWGYSEDSLYLAFQIQRPPGYIEPAAKPAKRDESLWRSNDFLELFINNIPDISRPLANYRDYYFQWNLLGSQYDRVEYPLMNIPWNPPWDIACRVVENFGWEGEVRWPLKIFEHTPAPQPGTVWRYTLFENYITPRPGQSYSAFSLQWASGRDFSSLLFTGDERPFARVLDCGMMQTRKACGMLLETVNPSSTLQPALVDIRLYKRKADAPSKNSYLRAFDQARDRPEDLAGHGKVATFVPDDKLSESLLAENYDLVKQTKKELTLAAGERQMLECLADTTPGNYLLIYDVSQPGEAEKRQLIAGGALPFVVPEPLMVKTSNFVLVDKTIQVNAELNYIEGWNSHGSVAAKLTSGDGKTVFEKLWPSGSLSYDLKFDLDVSPLPAGEYALHTLASDASGKTLAERRTAVVVPPTPQWFSQPVGVEPIIPPPWKPIETRGKTIAFLMGEYELGDSVLPSQIRAKSIYETELRPLLRGPMRLVAKIEGKEVSLSGGATVAEKKPELVTIRSASQAQGLAMTGQVEFEYDGMGKATLTVAPAQSDPVAVDELWLEIPLQKEFSTVLSGLGAPLLPAEGIKSAFTNVLTIGNDERRFVFFAESMRGWKIESKFSKEAVEVINGPDGATLRINLIKVSKPFEIAKPREIVFGFMFTPVKPIYPVPMHTVYFGAKPAREVAECGVNVFERWDFYNELQGWPEFRTEQTRARSAADVKTAHDLGVMMAPYTGWFIHRLSSVYPIFGSEMVSDPMIDGGVGCDMVCWNTPVQDVFTSLLKDRVADADIDGFRMDAGFVSLTPCQSLKHRGYGSTCGWHDDNGKLQPSLGIFAARKAAERAYRVFKVIARKDGLCLQHQGVAKMPMIFSFLDASVNAEGPDMHIRTLKEYPLANYRSGVMGEAFGVQTIFLPKSDVTGYDSRFGISLLHNLVLRGVPGVADREISNSRSAGSPAGIWLTKQKWMRYLQPGSEFWGYWKNQSYVQIEGGEEMYASFHLRRGDRMLLAVMNVDRQPVDAIVKLPKLAELGFKQAFAQDAWSGEDVPLENGSLPLRFTPESYRLIKITATKPPPAVPQKLGANLLSEAEPGKWSPDAPPTGWTIEGPKPILEKAQLVLLPGATLRKPVPLQSGKTYMLEVEARVECDDGAYLGPKVEHHLFEVSVGEPYNRGFRTLSSQMLPGQYQTMRAVWTAGDNPAAVSLRLTDVKGKALVRSITLHEVAR